jgi:hypothetical protein
MGSVFDRLVLPVVKPGASRATLVRYFPHVRAQVGAISKTAKVYASGGVVRAAISYLYAEMYEGVHRIPPAPPEETLQRIINSKDDLPGIELRGVGADFDILIADAGEDFQKCSDAVLRTTNSTETHYGARNEQGGLKRTIYTVGDVKEYVEQTNRASRQGGSTLDLLSFDTAKRRFIEPERFPDIVDDLVRGVYSYVGPETAANVEDAAKQTIRGLRPLLELPFLRLKDEKLLTKELAELSENAKKKGLSKKAWEQFDKMLRNARFSGANNRIYRGAPGTIDATLRSLQAKLAETKGQYQIIPEFVDRLALTDRRRKLASRLRGSGAFVSMKDFISCCTADGKLLHGTSDLESGLAILRGGLFISKDNQGTAAYGRGGYTSKDPRTAKEYAGTSGVIFELEVKRDPNLTILDWEKAKNLPEFMKINDAAIGAGKDPFEVLAREYGVDIILHKHVLIQNTEAVSFPRKASQLVHSYVDQITNPSVRLPSRLEALRTFLSLSEYLEAVGDPVPPKHLREVKSSLLAAAVQEAASASSSLDASRTALRTFDSLGTYFLSTGEPLPRTYLDAVMSALLTQVTLEDGNAQETPSTHDLLVKSLNLRGETLRPEYSSRLDAALLASKKRQAWFDDHLARRKVRGFSSWGNPTKPKSLEELASFLKTSGASNAVIIATMREVVREFGADEEIKRGEKAALEALNILADLESKGSAITGALAEAASGPKRNELADRAINLLGKRTQDADRAAEVLLDMRLPLVPRQYTLADTKILALSGLLEHVQTPTRERVIQALVEVVKSPALSDFSRLSEEAIKLPEIQRAILGRLRQSSSDESLSEGALSSLLRIKSTDLIPEIFDHWDQFDQETRLRIASSSIADGVIQERFVEPYVRMFKERAALSSPPPLGLDILRVAKLWRYEGAQILLVEQLAKDSSRTQALLSLLNAPSPPGPVAQRMISERISTSIDGVCAAAVALKHGFAAEKAQEVITGALSLPPGRIPKDFFHLHLYEILLEKGDRLAISEHLRFLLQNPPQGLQTPLPQYAQRICAALRGRGQPLSGSAYEWQRLWPNLKEEVKPALAALFAESSGFSSDFESFAKKLADDPNPAVRAAVAGNSRSNDASSCIPSALKDLKPASSEPPKVPVPSG